MSFRGRSALALACGYLLARVAAADCVTTPVVQWLPGDGGNGHFYQAVCSSGTWEQAKNAAVAVGRHLAAITSTEENAFVFDLVDDAGFWDLDAASCNLGPWLGASQPLGATEPAGDWTWVTGEPFSFTAWWPPNEPNDSGGDEDFLHFFNCASAGQRSAHWNDNDATSLLAYVVEWEHSIDIDGDGEVLPLTDGLLILRRLFGFTGAPLVAGAVDADCTRCDDDAIEPYLALLLVGRVYDATTDWSDASNPNAQWSYREGTNLLPHVAAWDSSSGLYPTNQPAWADSENGTNRIPAFMKSVGGELFTHDFVTGDLVIHSWDAANGSGNSDARLRFDIPFTGTYRVDLDVWIGREIGRSVNWAFFVENDQKASGNVASGDGLSRSAPGGYEESLALVAGDQAELRLATQSVSGDLVGVRLGFEGFGIDVDGDGESQPLTDGLLILRRLFGFSGNALTTGAIDGGCTRCSAAAIIDFIAEMGGPPSP